MTVVRRQNPVVGLAVQSLKRLCSGYDAIDNAFYIAQARVSNMLRAQRRHVKIKMEVNASPRLSSLGSRFEIGLVYHGLYSAAVCPGLALGDLVIDLPSPPTTPDLASTTSMSSATLTFLLPVREFALRDSSVESSALVTQNRSRSIANYTMRNVKMHARLAFGHPCLAPGRTMSRRFLCHPLWTQCWWAISGPQDASKTSTRICLSSQRSSTSKLSTSGAYNLTWITWSPRLSDKVRCSHVFMTAMNDEAAAEERREAALGFVEEPSEESGSGAQDVDSQSVLYSSSIR
ncbi:hypothetical protein D6C82_04288 [Aureobasidium pullulans]|nr:hypothetical protein D6C82_04288 [Aureobasidium pullulans]